MPIEIGNNLAFTICMIVVALAAISFFWGGGKP
ncbi:hypothetical protein LCGC14_0415910 [marine sediment metagenome]|uniref:Uncharacterized protein n=1 Tax=marine sediment metagenome TaxID=412755 RepID=A0A0F9SSH2_9ZZZZ